MERELESDRSLWSLFEAIVQLDERQECARFFRDLCTLTELKAMAERWEVAQLVALDIPYRRISELTGASTATITRVAHWVKHGEGGYREALARAQRSSQRTPSARSQGKGAGKGKKVQQSKSRTGKERQK